MRGILGGIEKITKILTALCGKNDKKEIVMSDVFHLNLTKAQLKGATLAIVPGDPARSERIAKNLITLSFLQVHVSSLLG